MKVGDKVYDTWFPWWGLGFIEKITKTGTQVRFVPGNYEPPPNNGKVVYDKDHAKFLRIEP